MGLFSFFENLFKRKSEYDRLLDKVGPLLVEAYRAIAEERGIAPTRAMSDKEIVDVYLRIEAEFKNAAAQRGETLPQENINTIVLFFYQVYEDAKSDGSEMLMYEMLLENELKNYISKGLPKRFRDKLVIFES